MIGLIGQQPTENYCLSLVSYWSMSRDAEGIQAKHGYSYRIVYGEGVNKSGPWEDYIHYDLLPTF